MDALSIEAIRDMPADQYLWVDVRPAALFIREHLVGSRNVPFLKDRPVPSPDPASPPIIIVAMAGMIARQAAQAWHETGHLVAGYVDAPFTALKNVWPADKIGRATIVPAESMQTWQSQKSGMLLDVRLPDDARRGIIPGSTWVPLPEVAEAAHPWDRSTPILTYCEAGGKAVEAAARLISLGFQEVFVVAQGGMGNWYQKGLPTEKPHE